MTFIRRAYTLIELLIVITIILVLAALLFPVFQQVKESSQKAVALTQGNQIGKALFLYAEGADGNYLPSTNWGAPDSDPIKIWPHGLMPFTKSEALFVAPGSKGIYPHTYSERGEMTIGYSSATALDMDKGCDDEIANTDKCVAFTTVASFDKGDHPDRIAMLALTPGGPFADEYRGYEFNPYNGIPDTAHIELSPPLVSDRDLVKELAPSLPAQAIEPLYCRYLATGKDTGETYVVFADGHAKIFSAAQILGMHTGIIWRFR